MTTSSRGIYYIRQRNRAVHRVWMSRMLAIAYAPITMRFILEISSALDVDGQKFFAAVMWLGFGINWFFVSLWLRRNNPPAELLHPSAIGSV